MNVRDTPLSVRHVLGSFLYVFYRAVEEAGQPSDAPGIDRRRQRGIYWAFGVVVIVGPVVPRRHRRYWCCREKRHYIPHLYISVVVFVMIFELIIDVICIIG